MCTDPRTSINSLEDAERKRAYSVNRISIPRCLSHNGCNHHIGGRRQEFVLVCNVPVNRPAAGGQSGREGAKRQSVLAFNVEDCDRCFNDLGF